MPVRIPKYLSADDAKALVAAIERPRDRLLVLLMLRMGLRLTEALTLSTENLDLDQGVAIVRGKGDKERVVPIDPEVEGLIRQYLDPEYRGLLILSNREERMGSRSAQYIVKHYGGRAEIKRRVTPHTLRHTFAVHYLLAGGNVRSLQRILGHSSLNTTAIYLDITDAIATAHVELPF